MNILQSKKGGAAILLTIAFSCLVLLSSCLFVASKAAAGRSYADAALRSAGRSVLSEYDKTLAKKYGLFAFYSDEREIARDIAFYANASLQKNKLLYTPIIKQGSGYNVFDIKQDAADIEVNLKEYSIMNADLFERQVGDAALTEWVSSYVRPAAGGDDKKETKSAPRKKRVLRNKSIIEALPSAALPGFSWPNFAAVHIPTAGELSDNTKQ